MSKCSRLVQRYQKELGRLIDQAPFDHAGKLEQFGQIAKLTMDVLGDESHRLTEELDELRSLIAQGDGFVIKHLFMPQPRRGEPHISRWWPLQMLLCNAAHCPVRVALADYLGLTESQLSTARDKGAEASVNLWSRLEYAQRLHQALPYLDFGDPPVQFDGHTLRYGDVEVQLREKQAAFLKLLRDAKGNWVTTDELKAKGMRGPADLKYKLTIKFKKKAIPLEIHQKVGAYMLPADALAKQKKKAHPANA